jgi:hypothetical protein
MPEKNAFSWSLTNDGKRPGRAEKSLQWRSSAWRVTNDLDERNCLNQLFCSFSLAKMVSFRTMKANMRVFAGNDNPVSAYFSLDLSASAASPQ